MFNLKHKNLNSAYISFFTNIFEKKLIFFINDKMNLKLLTELTVKKNVWSFMTLKYKI